MKVKSIICGIPLILAVVAAEGGITPNMDPTDIDCLATAIYKEARGEPVLGQLAVAQVVLNRGTNICRTVNQPGQFSWRANSRLYYDEDAYNLARTILNRGYALRRFTATHFHNLTVTPNWTGYLITIGNHKFYKITPVKK